MKSTERVQEAADQLASEAWSQRESSGELKRIEEIRRLAREQLADDVYSTSGQHRDRIGRKWVEHFPASLHDDEFVLWTARSPEQQALEAGMSPFIERLEGNERVLIRWRYSGQLSERKIAKLLNVGKATVSRRLIDVHEKLRVAMEEAFQLEEAVR